MSVVAKLVSNASQIILEKKDCIERINPFARRSITSCLILRPEALRETIGMKWINRVLAFVRTEVGVKGSENCAFGF